MKLEAKPKTAKEIIIEAALDLFYEKGYLATGISEIIERAGISKGAFYHYFPSKEDLCVAYLQERHSRWGGELKAAVNKAKTPKERYLVPFEFIKEWMQDCDYRGCAFLNISSEIIDRDSKIRKEVIYTIDGLRAVVRELVKGIKKSNDKYGHIDEQKVADEYYTIFEGAIKASQVYGETWPIDAARNAALKILL